MEKETYTFTDRGGDDFTLRPEGTAPVCRAYLQHGMQNLPQPVRLYYLCPVFRYERPQSGRFRQHQQFGVESIGDEDASLDAEVIELAWRFSEALGLRNLALNINTIGDDHCRAEYIDVLQKYYKGRTEPLCQDCHRRLLLNPLRLLDCKQMSCQPVIEEAPRSVDYLCGECSDHWNHLQHCLTDIGLNYTIENRLVRGFDYYTRTVFEIVPPVEGRMSTIAGGGRYDGLIEELGGRPTPGVGFGMGLERVIANLRLQNFELPYAKNTRVLVAHVGSEAMREAVRLASKLRQQGISTTIGPSKRGLRSQLKYASTIRMTHVVIIGQDELLKGSYILRNMGKGEQIEVRAEEVFNHLRQDSQSMSIN